MENTIFEKVGQTIKKVFKILFYVTLCIGIIKILLGIYNILFQSQGDLDWYGLLVYDNTQAAIECDAHLFGCKLYINSGINTILTSLLYLLAYGVGEIVECAQAMRNKMCGMPKVEEKKEEKQEEIYIMPKEEVKKNSDGSWVCNKCGSTNENHTQYCKGCGKYI